MKKEIDLGLGLITGALLIAFCLNGTWPYCVALCVMVLAHVAREMFLGQGLKTQTQELIAKLNLMEDRFKAVEIVAEDAKKRLTEANMAAGFKIGK